MATTFRDFMVECATYEYSQKHFDILKEISELALMERYMENQNFMYRNPGLFTSGINFESGYFIEAADEKEKSNFLENLGKKAAGIWAKIVNTAKHLWRVFIKWLKRIKAKFSKDHMKVLKIRSAFLTMKITDAVAKEMIAIANEGKEAAGPNFKLMGKQPGLNVLSGKYNSQEYKNACVWITAGISDSKVFVEPSGNGDDCAVNLEDVLTTFNYLKDFKAEQVSAAHTYLKKAMGRAKSKGLVIDVPELNEAGGTDKLAEKYEEQITKIMSKANVDTSNPDSEESKAFEAFITSLSNAVTLTMAAYNSYEAMHAKIYTKIQQYFHLNEGSSSEDQTEPPPVKKEKETAEPEPTPPPKKPPEKKKKAVDLDDIDAALNFFK